MNKNLYNTSKQNCKPSLDYLETLRSRKLYKARRDVKRVIEHVNAPWDHRTHYLKQVVLLVAEIAVLDRSGPDDDHSEYLALIEDTLDIDPWDAVGFWKEHALGPIHAASEAWKAHVVQASLRAEPRAYRHVKLIDLVVVSDILDLDRELTRIVFGSDKCVLPPRKVRDSRFDADQRQHIREIANAIGRTPEHLYRVLKREGDTGLEAAIDKARAQMEKRQARKPGRPANPDATHAKIESTARELKTSPRTIRYGMAEYKKSVTEEVENTCFSDAESVTFAQEVCHVCTETPKRETPISTLEYLQTPFSENEEHDASYALAEVAMNHQIKPRKKYVDKELLIQFWKETKGEDLKPDRIRQWMKRGKYQKLLPHVNAWASLKAIEQIDLEKKKGIKK